MGCHHGTGRAQCWHLAVTCNVKVVIVKKIVIVAYLPYQIIQNYSWGLIIWISGEADTDRKFWLVLDAISYVTWLMNRSHRRRGHGSDFLTAVTYSSQSNSKLYVQKNNCVPNHPVELAQWPSSIMRRCVLRSGYRNKSTYFLAVVTKFMGHRDCITFE